MITKVSQTPCWAVPRNDEGDEIHFATETEAVECYEKYEFSGPRPYQLPVVCWSATCDRDFCDNGETDEDGDELLHIPALNVRHAMADLQSLSRVGRDLLCWECRGELFPPADPSKPPMIVSYDEVARLIGLVAVLFDQVPKRPYLQTHQFAARLAALTSRVPAGRDGSWMVDVRPFALEVPLPGMPAVSITTTEELR